MNIRRNKLYAEVANNLEKLRKLRTKADYNDKFFQDEERRDASLMKQCEDAVATARTIVDKIEEIKQLDREL